MGGILQVDTIQNNNATTLITQTNSTTLTFGVSGQNIVIPSGVTFNTASATVTLPTTIKVDTIQNTNSTNLITQTNVTTITFGATSQTISVPSVASFASTIGVGGATPSTSGAGITFPASASGSTDANTLDDYEEGTWTPTLTSASGSGMTFDSRGTYVKIGKQVTVLFDIQITAKGTASGALKLAGLPFTRDTSYVMGASSIGYFVGMSTSLVLLSVYIESNATTGVLSKTTAAATAVSDLLVADFTAVNGRFATTVTYLTA